MSILESALAAKILGSMAGSTIAVVYHGKGTKKKLIERFIIGALLGFACAPFMLDAFGKPHTLTYWFSASLICGALAHYILSIFFALKFEQLLKMLTAIREIKK